MIILCNNIFTDILTGNYEEDFEADMSYQDSDNDSGQEEVKICCCCQPTPSLYHSIACMCM